MTMRLVLVAVAVLAAKSFAADQPLAGKTLSLKRSASSQVLKLELRDAGIAAPVPGTADDPSLHGLSLQLFGRALQEMETLAVPAGPGWTVRSASPIRYTYRNPMAPSGPSPIRTLVYRAGKGVKLVARQVGLDVSAPQGAVGVLVRTGGAQVCGLFDPPSVKRDVAGLFSARNADAPASCASGALFATPCGEGAYCDGSPCADPNAVCSSDLGNGCVCISGAQPCGDTAPACNGECPAGEACSDVGGVPYPSCACLPAGSTGCGTVGTCSDGDCPAGLGCYTQTFTCCGGFTITGCGCASGPPPPPCGGPCPPGSICAGPVPGFPQACYPTNCSGSSCPAGSTCAPIGGGMYCAPIPCSGGSGYPICNGTCDPGLSCHGYVQGSGACYCAP